MAPASQLKSRRRALAGGLVYGSFSGTYHRFRPRYGDGPYDLIRARATAFEHAVDLGAGTGHVTRDLLPMFTHVTAIEPDQDMARLLPKNGRLTKRIERAEDAVIAEASADVVVCGSAFHWMNAKVVSRLVRTWLKLNGFFFVFGIPSTPDSVHIVPDRAHDPIREETPKWEAYKGEPVMNWIPYLERLKSTEEFEVVEGWQGEIVVRWTPLEMAGYFVSLSFAGIYARNQSETRDYLGMLRERIAHAVGTERIEARITLEGAIAHNRSLQGD